MGTLKCEVCGCEEIIKEDGAFTCRSCGMKYSLAEARKLLFAEETPEQPSDASVVVPEAVPVMQSTEKCAPDVVPEDSLLTGDKALIAARRAKLKENWTEASKLYGAVEKNDPTNIEAFFYAAYSDARDTLKDPDLYRRQIAFKALEKSIGMIPESFDVEREKEQAVLLRKISADVVALDKVPFAYHERKNGFGTLVSTDKLDTITLLNNINAAMIKAFTGVYEKYGGDDVKTIYLFECRLAHFDHLIKVGKLGDSSRLLWMKGRMALHRTWQGIDPAHKVPDREEDDAFQRGGKKGIKR